MRNLGAYQLAAGAVVLRTYDQAERIRVELGRSHPWQAAERIRVRLLAIWVVQTCFVAADRVLAVARQGSGPDEWLPAGVASWLEPLYRLGNAWVPRLEQLLAGDDDAVDAGLPVELARPAGPGLPGSPEATVDETRAVVALVEGLVAQVDLVWNEVECGHAVPRELRPWAGRMRQRYVGVRSVVDQQRDLWIGRPVGALRREVHDRLWGLGEELFRLGQGMIVPRLFDPGFTLREDRVRPGGAGETPERRMLAALRQWLGFDPWLLTAAERRADPTRDVLCQLDEFWRRDPDPQATRRVCGRLGEVLAAGQIVRRAGEMLRECPWSPVYVVTSTVHVGERLGKATIFAFNPKLVGGVFTHQFTRLGTDPAYADPPPRPDPWFFSDPEVRERRAADADARARLASLWAADDHPERTRELLEQVAQAESAGAIRRRPRKAWGSCPWPSTFVALRRLGIGGEAIRAGEVFALTAEVAGGEFIRRIIRIGRYQPR